MGRHCYKPINNIGLLQGRAVTLFEFLFYWYCLFIWNIFKEFQQKLGKKYDLCVHRPW